MFVPLKNYIEYKNNNKHSADIEYKNNNKHSADIEYNPLVGQNILNCNHELIFYRNFDIKTFK